jgi:predicted N-acetyltransferase YhbS
MQRHFDVFLQHLMNINYHIQTVTESDIPAITQLVNSAYQGEPGSKSWTSEGNIVAGQRTTEDVVRNLLQQPGISMLKCFDEQQTIVGCVLLEKKENTLYLGMLSVDPQMQASGIGKLLLQQGELYAQDQGYDTVTITVINIRHELIDWYKRKGYRPTGNSQPFSNHSSKALANFSFMEMKKEL